jgi:hypothetical protein
VSVITPLLVFFQTGMALVTLIAMNIGNPDAAERKIYIVLCIGFAITACALSRGL